MPGRPNILEELRHLRADMLLSADAHDLDVVIIDDHATEPRFEQRPLPDGTRADCIIVHPNLGPDEYCSGGKDSFQSPAMLIATVCQSTTSKGEAMIYKCRSYYTPEEVSRHYVMWANRFFYGPAFNKSWADRKNAEGLSQIKKLIPLYRIGHDLLPKAQFMERFNAFPGTAVPWELDMCEMLVEANYIIDRALECQDISDEKLLELADILEGVLQVYLL